MGAEQEVPEPAYDGVIELWVTAAANRTGAVIMRSLHTRAS